MARTALTAALTAALLVGAGVADAAEPVRFVAASRGHNADSLQVMAPGGATLFRGRINAAHHPTRARERFERMFGEMGG
jgi:hypothetical protein